VRASLLDGAGLKHRLDLQCEDLGSKDTTTKNLKFTYSRAEFVSFYSQRLDTCVQYIVDELEGSFLIRDIEGDYYSAQMPFPEGYPTDGPPIVDTYLFRCMKHGFTNVILEKADKFRGNFKDVSPLEYIESSVNEKQYSREDCRALFRKKLKEIE